MRDFLITHNPQPRYRKQPKYYFGFIILLLISLCNSFAMAYAGAGSAIIERVAGPGIPEPAREIIMSVQETDTLKPAVEELPGKVSRDDFKKKALAKIKEFQGCLFILCDKTATTVAQDNAIDQASSLFVDGAIIEVSSVNSNEKKHLKVRDFLEKLRSF